MVIVWSVFFLQVQSLAFHVHASIDHTDRRSHQHGPAIHHHEDFDSALHVDEPELSSRGKVITVAVPAATPASAVVVDAAITESPRAPELRLIGDARSIDVRSHSPPHSRSAFLRGPPASTLL